MGKKWFTTDNPLIFFEDTSVDPYRRPHRWAEGEGHIAIERFATPEGVVGAPSKVTLRTPEEMEPYLKEPFSEGWKSVYELHHIGPFQRG